MSNTNNIARLNNVEIIEDNEYYTIGQQNMSETLKPIRFIVCKLHDNERPSYNTNDVDKKYCVRCNNFLDSPFTREIHRKYVEGRQKR